MSNNYYLKPGVYECEIEQITVKTDQKGRTVVSWKMHITKGPHAGEEIVKKFYLTSDLVKKFLQKELAMIGIHIRNGKDLMAKKGQAVGKIVDIIVTINEQGYGVFYLQGLTKQGVEKNFAHKDEEDDDDIPW